MFTSYLSLILLLFPTALGTPAPKSQQCRCIYGDSCWPTDAEFYSLASLLSQPLLHPLPTAHPCYPSSAPVGNCSEVQASYTDGIFRSDIPGSMQNTNFETYLFPNGTIDACYLNVTLNIPCNQGSVPPIGVDIRKSEDAQAAINFARQKNLRLVIKNTGHDYLGRSTARGGFLLWTHHLKDKAYNAAFVPQGGPSTQTYEGKIEQISIDLTRAHIFLLAVTFGAGVQWYEAYDYVDQQGRFIIGGISQGGSVGSAGGWVMGGGHSAFSPSLGLGTYR